MEIKIFVNVENMATFICPECNTTKTANVVKYMEYNSKVSINCRCKNCNFRYLAYLERRKYYRKNVNFTGTYIMLENTVIRGNLIVKDISRSGIQFEVPKQVKFKKDAILDIKFILDDVNKSLIKKQIKVISIKKNGYTVGVKYTSLDDYDQLGPYLLV